MMMWGFLARANAWAVVSIPPTKTAQETPNTDPRASHCSPIWKASSLQAVRRVEISQLTLWVQVQSQKALGASLQGQTRWERGRLQFYHFQSVPIRLCPSQQVNTDRSDVELD